MYASRKTAERTTERERGGKKRTWVYVTDTLKPIFLKHHSEHQKLLGIRIL